MGYQVLPGDEVSYGGERLRSEKLLYFLLNKPRGVLSTMSDDEGRPCVGDIVADKTLDYLKRHVDMEKRLSKGGSVHYLTTDTAEFFKKGAFRFGMEDISEESLTF